MSVHKGTEGKVTQHGFSTEWVFSAFASFSHGSPLWGKPTTYSLEALSRGAPALCQDCTESSLRSMVLASLL